MGRIRYRRGPRSISVSIPDGLVKPICHACRGTFTGRQRNTHHWREAYSFPEMRENNLLVLENSVQVCVKHHRVANDIRGIVESLQRGHITNEGVRRLVRSMPVDMYTTFLELVEELHARG